MKYKFNIDNIGDNEINDQVSATSTDECNVEEYLRIIRADRYFHVTEIPSNNIEIPNKNTENGHSNDNIPYKNTQNSNNGGINGDNITKRVWINVQSQFKLFEMCSKNIICINV